MTYLDEISNVSINDICNYLTEHKKAVSVNNIQIIIESLLNEDVLTEELLQEKNVFKIGKELVTRPIARMQLVHFLNKYPAHDNKGNEHKPSLFDDHNYLSGLLDTKWREYELTKDNSYDLDENKVKQLKNKGQKNVKKLNDARNLLNRPLIPTTKVIDINVPEYKQAMKDANNDKTGIFTMYNNGSKKVAIAHGSMNRIYDKSAGNYSDSKFDDVFNNPEKYGNVDNVVTCFGGASKYKKYHILKNGGKTYPICASSTNRTNSIDNEIGTLVLSNDIDEANRVANRLQKKYDNLKEKNTTKFIKIQHKQSLNAMTPEQRRHNNALEKEYSAKINEEKRKIKISKRNQHRLEKKHNIKIVQNPNNNFDDEAVPDENSKNPNKLADYQKKHNCKLVITRDNGILKGSFVKNKPEETDISKQNDETKD